MAESYDVVIVGAGISGIDTAYRMQEQCPDRTYTILEGKAALGGTWEQFKFPGIRSDSDLHTFGFPFRPWKEENAIAEAAPIVKYLNETAQEYGIDRKIQFHHKVKAADWSSDQQSWNLDVDGNGQRKRMNCKFLLLCTGYFDHDSALPAKIPGIENFQGTVIHPQFWPEDLDYTGKNVVIVGSGATAITLLPNVAKKAAHVTQLQRSPTFVVALPQDDVVNRAARSFLPTSWSFKFIRMKYLLAAWLFYKYCRLFPAPSRRMLKKGVAQSLPKGYNLNPNFEPKYQPWDQRVCFTPKGDYFQALSTEKADVITATIKNVTNNSIMLDDGNVLRPDIIVTATGLRVLMAGGINMSVDKQPVDVPEKFIYKGMMIQDVPNAAVAIGYTNASWTLGSDCTAHFITRLLNHMKSNDYTSATPHVDQSQPLKERNLLELNSTYIVKAKGALPKGGDRWPWLPRTMYLRDLWEAKHGAYTELDFASVST